MQFIHVQSFEQWRAESRRLLAAEIPPAEIHWSPSEQPSLFGTDQTASSAAARSFTVPKVFLDLAQTVACHRDSGRWELLYRTLWRITHGESNLLKIITDDDVHQLVQMRKAVNRDVHKMKAFVRFRKVITGCGPVENVEQYIAWHRPDHLIVRLASPFFARRFQAMNWAIMTPDESVRWDQRELHYGPGVPVSDAPSADELEELWKTYYSSTFNPARINLRMMKREMPVRHWPTLPETELIPELLGQAAGRVQTMLEATEGFQETASNYLPDTEDLGLLAAAAKRCQACDLHCDATQTVFGEGAADAKIVVVGEQPGDQEDLQGRPFVGPSGKLLDQALAEAGIRRGDVYVTNVVKHFKWIQRGKRRLHKKPSAREIAACRPWLEAELEIVRPQTLFCLGATAAQAIVGRDFRITESRGQVVRTHWCQRTIASWHPAAILRIPDEQRQQQMRQQLIADLARCHASSERREAR